MISIAALITLYVFICAMNLLAGYFLGLIVVNLTGRGKQ